MDDDAFPRTDFVRRTLEQRRYEPDVTYARDLLALERLLSTRAVGMAESIALSNLVSRYPREVDAIVGELGVRPFVPLVAERLQLALRRHPLPRMRGEEPPHPFEF